MLLAQIRGNFHRECIYAIPYRRLTLQRITHFRFFSEPLYIAPLRRHSLLCAYSPIKLISASVLYDAADAITEIAGERRNCLNYPAQVVVEDAEGVFEVKRSTDKTSLEVEIALPRIFFLTSV